MQCSGRAEAQPALGALLAAPSGSLLGSLLRPHSAGAHEHSCLCHCWSWHWSSRGVGEGGTVTAQWEWAAPGVGCPAAFLQHIPLRPWMCSVISKTQRQARIQLGPRLLARATLSGCATAGAQERRDSGGGGDGGLDKDDAWPHQAGEPTAVAASLCRRARGDGGTWGSSPCGWGCLTQAIPCA